MISNWLRVQAAGAFINAVRLVWRVLEILTRRRLPAVQHYLVMQCFRTLFTSYPVTISYPNPLTPDHTLRLTLDLCENAQQWFFRLRGRYELEQIRFLGRALESVETFVDVGANVGVFAATLAQAFRHRRVVAVEPLWVNYARLCRNIELNQLDNVRAIHGAVTPEDGDVTFYVNPIHDGGGSVIPPDMYRTGDVAIAVEPYLSAHPEFASRQAVRSVRLDALVGGRPAAVKVDVENGEIGVLESGRTAMQRRLVRALVIEVRASTAKRVVELLQAQGYACTTLDNEGRGHPIDLGVDRPLMNLHATPAE